MSHEVRTADFAYFPTSKDNYIPVQYNVPQSQDKCIPALFIVP